MRIYLKYLYNAINIINPISSLSFVVFLEIILKSAHKYRFNNNTTIFCLKVKSTMILIVKDTQLCRFF